MKKVIFILFFTSFLVSSCVNGKKYNSYLQAKQACERWTEEDRIQIIRQNTWTINRRWCIEEEKTSQILGLQNTRKKEGLVKRNFKY